MGVPVQEGLDIVLEDVEVVCPGQCVLEWHDVDFFELGCLVPIRENLGVAPYHTKAKRLRRLHLQEHFSDLEHHSEIEEPHALRIRLSVGRVLGREIIRDALREQRVCAHFVRPPSAELDLLELNDGASVEEKLRVHVKDTLGWIALDNDELDAVVVEELACLDYLLSFAKPSKLRSNGVQPRQALHLLCVPRLRYLREGQQMDFEDMFVLPILSPFCCGRRHRR
mmetsp:Transcript_71116/g.197541  ORF Transcript_71116/g.197541 Transcript_71116/m.197541 type:complete len:225 (+) Transcript_71116:615-1289(+)